jgi:hypothetical protein
MPCPFFEPRAPVRTAALGGRLPLLDEYDGICHAASPPVAAPEGGRFRLCNHGNSRGECATFPAEARCTSLRYEMMQRENGSLRILCIEEEAYTPVRWYVVDYGPGETLNPQLEDICARAQMLSFCRSYLARFPR